MLFRAEWFLHKLDLWGVAFSENACKLESIGKNVLKKGWLSHNVNMGNVGHSGRDCPGIINFVSRW
jgi:hypothetical protein